MLKTETQDPIIFNDELDKAHDVAKLLGELIESDVRIGGEPGDKPRQGFGESMLEGLEAKDDLNPEQKALIARLGFITGLRSENKRQGEVSEDTVTFEISTDSIPLESEEAFEITLRFIKYGAGIWFTIDEMRNRLQINGVILPNSEHKFKEWFGKAKERITEELNAQGKRGKWIEGLNSDGETATVFAPIRTRQPARASSEVGDHLKSPVVESTEAGIQDLEIEDNKITNRVTEILVEEGDVTRKYLLAKLTEEGFRHDRLKPVIAEMIRSGAIFQYGKKGRRVLSLERDASSSRVEPSTEHEITHEEKGFDGALGEEILGIYLAPGTHVNQMYSLKEIANKIGRSVTKEEIASIKKAVDELVLQGYMIAEERAQTRKGHRSRSRKVKKYGLKDQGIKDFLKNLSQGAIAEILE